MSSIDKKRYTMLLMNLDRRTYNAYKKMTLSSKNSSDLYTAPQTQTNISHLKSESSSKRQSYVDYISMRNQSSYPFGQTEQRFKWQNLNDKSNLVDPDDAKNKIRRIHKTSNFQGGFLEFFNNNKPPKEKEKKKSKKSGSVDRYQKFVNNTKRVINPELDTDERDFKHINGKKMFDSKNDLRHSTNGSFLSLIAKTPMTFQVKGKKQFLDRSFNENTINLFSEDYGRIEKVKPSRKMFNHSTDYSMRNNTMNNSIEMESEEPIRRIGIRCRREWKN